VVIQNGCCQKASTYKNKFSDRLGITSLRTVLQIEEINNDLRNPLWNYLLRTILVDSGDICHRTTRIICEDWFKDTVDKLPYNYYQQKEWLREFLSRPALPWYEIYNLIEFIPGFCTRSRKKEWKLLGYSSLLFIGFN